MLDERSFRHVKSQESTFVYRTYTVQRCVGCGEVQYPLRHKYANEPVLGYSAFCGVAPLPESTNSPPTHALLFRYLHARKISLERLNSSLFVQGWIHSISPTYTICLYPLSGMYKEPLEVKSDSKMVQPT